MKDATVRGRGEESGDQVYLLILVSQASAGLTVQVWDRGESAGLRSVSAAGPPPVVARRIALAVSELGRELSRKRAVAYKRELAERALLEEQKALARRRAFLELPRLESRVQSLVLPDHGYLIGPSLGLSLNGDYPYRVALSLSYLQGQLTGLTRPRQERENPFWLAYEAGLSVERVLHDGEKMGFSFGLELRALLLRAEQSVSFDHLAGQRDSYSVFGGLRSTFALKLSTAVASTLTFHGGPVLRSFSVERGANSDIVSGFYGGLSLGIEIPCP